jgi:hypothetical protein
MGEEDYIKVTANEGVYDTGIDKQGVPEVVVNDPAIVNRQNGCFALILHLLPLIKVFKLVFQNLHSEIIKFFRFVLNLVFIIVFHLSWVELSF